MKPIKKKISRVPQRTNTDNIINLNIKDIIPDESQPRYIFETELITDLAKSIERDGLLHPIIVKSEGRKYKIVTGERRYRAFKFLKREEIPCRIITDKNERETFRVQLAENLVRADLTPIEKANAILRYKKLLGAEATWTEVETQLNISESRRKQFIRLLELPEEMQDAIVNQSPRRERGQITEGHARALVKLEALPDKQKELFARLTNGAENITSHEAMYLANHYLAQQQEKNAPVALVIEYRSKEELLRKLHKTIEDVSNGIVSQVKTSSDTKIEWTNKSWNPSSGCTKVTAGCVNCYAEKNLIRLKSQGKKNYQNGFKFTLQPDQLVVPFNWRKPELVFVNSISDLFHEDMPDNYLDTVMSIIKDTPRHTYQILTKRPAKMRAYFSKREVPENAWLGVTVENKKQGIPRMRILKQINARVRYISAEPLLEDLGKMNLTGIDWVIVGGESGPKARKMEKEWVRNIKTQCEEQEVAFFFKQWGVYNEDGEKVGKHSSGCEFEGREYKAYPSAIKNTLKV